MNTLVINGSPRGDLSNTLTLTKAFLDGAGITDFDMVDVGSLNIGTCKGCFACWKTTQGECVIRDDMAGVLDKLKDAELVIWSFPLYYFSVPSGLKSLIDRQLPMNLPFMTGDTGGISAKTAGVLKTLLYPKDVFESMADASWGVVQTAGGESVKADESLTFTRQMAALYNRTNYDKDRVLEMNYTDLSKRYQIILTKNGARVVCEELSDADTVISTSFSVWQAIAKGEMEGSEALAQGKYSVTGDFSLMLKWDELFGGDAPAKPPDKGGFAKRASLVNAANIAGAAAFASFLLSRADVWYLLAAQLFFAVFWGASVFMKIPMTCYFSATGYGGEKMLSNVLFTRTNRILTACWAVEFLLMAAALIILYLNNAPTWFAALTYIPAPLLGVFTGWFAKWYPAKMARGKSKYYKR